MPPCGIARADEMRASSLAGRRGARGVGVQNLSIQRTSLVVHYTVVPDSGVRRRGRLRGGGAWADAEHEPSDDGGAGRPSRSLLNDYLREATARRRHQTDDGLHAKALD